MELVAPVYHLWHAIVLRDAYNISHVGAGGDRRNHGVVCAVADYLKPI